MAKIRRDPSKRPSPLGVGRHDDRALPAYLRSQRCQNCSKKLVLTAQKLALTPGILQLTIQFKKQTTGGNTSWRNDTRAAMRGHRWPVVREDDGIASRKRDRGLMLLFSEADGVITRFLEDHERPYPTGEARLPLVIEPAGERSRNLSFLKAFLSKRSVAVKSALYDYGAVLLRGFQVASEPDFEESLLSIQGVQAMSCYFMSEPGREIIKGTSSVWSTNTEHKTGGTFDFHAFHSENFYTTDVPAIQSFWCKKAPWLGGETAFTHMAHAYAELDAALKSRLESEPVWAVRWSIERLATRYRIPEDVVEAFCVEIGLKVLSFKGTKYVIVAKPAVYVHPHTRNRSLQVNLSAEMPGLQAALRKRFLPHYKGLKWAPHRYGWKHDRVESMLAAINRVTTRTSPKRLLTRLASRGWSKSAQRHHLRSSSRGRTIGAAPSLPT